MTRRIGLILLIAVLAVSAPAGGHAASGIRHAADDIRKATTDERTDREALRILLERSNAHPAGASENVSRITPLDTARMILAHNLAIMDSEVGKKYAAQALREAESLFDPVLRAKAAYYNGHTYPRTEEDDKFLKNTISIGGSDPVFVTYGDTSPIKYLRFNEERKEGYYPRKVRAVDPPPWRGGETLDYSLGLSADIFWGPSLDFSLLMREQKNHWENEDKSWGDYNRPFRSEFRENLIFPLPWTKNFGPYSKNDADVKQAEILDQASGWSVRAAVADALLAGELAYWDLTAALLRLRALENHGANLRTLLDKTNRLYDDRLCTEYDLALVKSAVTSSLDGIEQGTAAYMTASNKLTDLTDASNSTLFMPEGYTLLFAQPLDNLPGEDTPEDVSANPRYGYQSALTASAEIGRLHHKNQALPNLRFNQMLTMTQAASAFGFGHAEHSLSHVFTSPDMIRQDYGMLYTYPLFNREAEARYEQAVLNVRAEQTRTRQLENALRREAADALALLAGARRRVGITAEGVRLARSAYEKAFDMQADREVTEFEILSKSSALLSAEFAYITARIDCRKSAARFLTALGTFQDRLGVDMNHDAIPRPEEET